MQDASRPYVRAGMHDAGTSTEHTPHVGHDLRSLPGSECQLKPLVVSASPGISALSGQIPVGQQESAADHRRSSPLQTPAAMLHADACIAPDELARDCQNRSLSAKANRTANSDEQARTPDAAWEFDDHTGQYSPSHAASHSTLHHGLQSPLNGDTQHEAQHSDPGTGALELAPGDQHQLTRLWSNAASALEACAASPFAHPFHTLSRDEHGLHGLGHGSVAGLVHDPEMPPGSLDLDLLTGHGMRAQQAFSMGHLHEDDAGESGERLGEGSSPDEATDGAGYASGAPAGSSSSGVNGSSASGSGSGTDSGSEEAESSDNMEFVLRYCLNCTAASSGTMCLDCGHYPQKDALLMNGTLSAPHGCMAAASTAVSTSLRPQSSSKTVLVYDERMEQHVEGRHQPHPERPDRIRAIMARLLASGLAAQCQRLPCQEASTELLHSIHQPEFVSAVDAMSAQLVPPRDHLQAVMQAYGEAPSTHAYFTPDTYVNRYTSSCARLAAGGCAAVAAAVARGDAANGAAIVRPPGHHAESGTAMGFCFYNNAGIAAKAAQAAGASRILILDWDVHHGNGTQHIFEDDPSVLFISLHRHDGGHFYPGTGDANEVGHGPGTGYTVNIPWPRAGMTDGDYLAAFMHIVLPIAYEYCPSLIIVSAGYDAALGDPIGGCRLTAEGYAHMTALLGAVAPMAILLEGGYNLGATAAGTEATLRVLLGEQPPALPHAPVPSAAALSAMQATIQCQAPFWQCMQALLPPQVPPVPPSPLRACPPTPQSITAGRLEADGPSSRISGPPLDPLDHEPLTSRGSGILARTPSATLHDHGDLPGDVSVHGPSLCGDSPMHRSRDGWPGSAQNGSSRKGRRAEVTGLDSLAEEGESASSADESSSSSDACSDADMTASSPSPSKRMQQGSLLERAETPQQIPAPGPSGPTVILRHSAQGVMLADGLGSQQDAASPELVKPSSSDSPVEPSGVPGDHLRSITERLAPGEPAPVLDIPLQRPFMLGKHERAEGEETERRLRPSPQLQ